MASLAAVAQTAPSWTLLAVAEDVHSAVMRDADGHIRRYAEGDWLAGHAWRLRRVDADAIELEAAKRLRGQPLVVRVALQQHFDPAVAIPSAEPSQRVPVPVAQHGGASHP
jgi:hypothetical protein